jgi:hypothetical protein
MRSGSGYADGRSSTACTTVKVVSIPRLVVDARECPDDRTASAIAAEMTRCELSSLKADYSEGPTRRPDGSSTPIAGAERSL